MTGTIREITTKKIRKMGIMSEQSVLTAKDYDELADETDLLDIAEQDAGEVDEELRQWFPTEYVVAIVGHRGGGKSVLLARYLLNGLIRGYPVFTNLELYPEKLGIDKPQQSLELDNLLSFDPNLSNAIIGIEELGTWIERMRAISTTNILVSKFFQLFIRKKGLRIFFTNQSPYLPSGIWEQVDMVINAHDLFYSEWGKEANLPKGTTFYYIARDVSGIFTGHPGTTWGFALRKANKLWPLFNSYQQFDPYQWARKTRITGADMILDLDEGEYYKAGEQDIRAQQEAIKQYSVVLTQLHRAWDNTLIKLARENNAITQDLPDRLVFSVGKLDNAILGLKGKKRKEAEKYYKELRKHAGEGHVARFGPEHKIIELAKPISNEGSYSQGD